MKLSARGPFSRIRWFCNDGQVLPPTPYACADFGGGRQHGQWSERTETLRQLGFAIANFYADIDIEQFVTAHARTDWFAQMLIEQFLISIDDGWILRRSRFYRGAYQAEQEQHAARELLLALVREDDWHESRFLMLRAAAKYLAHGTDNASVQEIRQLSASLSDRDSGFRSLRNKIHGQPEISDAVTVHQYAQKTPDPTLLPDLERLANLIEQAHSADIDGSLRSLAAATNGQLAEIIDDARTIIKSDADRSRRIHVLAELLAEMRTHFATTNASRRLQILDSSLIIENEFFNAAAALLRELKRRTRSEKLLILRDNLQALYGVGIISKRQLEAASRSIEEISNSANVTVGGYKQVVDYLALVPNWGSQNLRRFFGVAMDKLSKIEPKSSHFIQDYLRGSPMFSFAAVIDPVVRDSSGLAGVSNELFDVNRGAGLRSLNPGLARGELHFALGTKLSELASENIYVLPETVSELPPIAGILTAGVGNPLSHVQLLARNLGIPNVGVDQDVIDLMRA
ncbi:MAG: pyruvate phosphate dikinase, partial [Gammaproteobacteria bacterium]